MKTWAQQAVADLEAADWSLTAIAAATGMHVASICDLKKGRTSEPRGIDRAIRLRDLWATKAKPPQNKAA